MAAELLDYERINIYGNPHSRQGRRLEDFRERAAQQTGKTAELFITGCSVDEDVDLLEANEHDGDLNLLVGGDGTLINMLSAVKLRGSTNTSVLLPAGRANDLAMQMVDDKAIFRNLDDLLRHGQKRPLFSIEGTFSPGGKGQAAKKDIWSTCGIGVSALASEVYNYDWYRSSRLHRLPLVSYIGEHAVAAGAVVAASSFRTKTVISQNMQDAIDEGYEPGNDPFGAYDHLTERIIANGDRMGKDMHIAADIFGRYGRVIDVHNRREAVGTLLRMVRGRPTGNEFNTQYEHTFLVSAAGDIHVQIGGETETYNGEVGVKVQRARQSVNVLTFLKQPAETLS